MIFKATKQFSKLATHFLKRLYIFLQQELKYVHADGLINKSTTLGYDY